MRLTTPDTALATPGVSVSHPGRMQKHLVEPEVRFMPIPIGPYGTASHCSDPSSHERKQPHVLSQILLSDIKITVF